MSAKLSQLVATPSPDPDDLMYIVRPVEGNAGSKQITNDNLFSVVTRNIADKTLRFDAPAIAPSLSAAGQAALYYSLAQNRLLLSENGGPYQSILSGVGRALPPRTDTVFATPVSEALQQYPLPANFLPTDLSYFRFNCAGNLVLNSNPKSMNVFLIGSAVYLMIFSQIITAPQVPERGWRIWGEVIRDSPTSFRSMTSMMFGTSVISANPQPLTSNGHYYSTIISTNNVSSGYFNDPIVLSVNATVTANNDISQDFTTVEVYQF